MKLSEFKKQPPAAEVPAAPTPEPVSETQSPNVEEPQGVSTITPSGIEVYYQPKRDKQRRLYKLRHHPDCIKEPWFSNYQGAFEWQEVPSVTKVLEVLGKDLTWWAMQVGAAGTKELAVEYGYGLDSFTAEELVELLKKHKLTTNDVRDSAADRGVNVHGILEEWVASDTVTYDNLADHEQPYVVGLEQLFLALDGAVTEKKSELMVGSLQHQYAGRFDLVLTLSKPVEVISKRYKPLEIPAGRYLIDLKTRKGGKNYKTDFLQLEAYEAAAVECGYPPTDYRAVVIVSADGRYKFLLNEDWSFEDFLVVRQCHQVMNEREIVRILRDELDAKEIS